MTPTERFHTALSGGKPDRVPVLPKIWFDLAAVLRGIEFRRVIEEPETATGAIVDAAMDVRADAARLFLTPRRQTRLVDGKLVEVDRSGKVLGPIDVDGGFTTRLSAPGHLRLEDPYHVAFFTSWTPPGPLVRSLEDVRRIAVPDKSFYEERGCGDLQRRVIRGAGDRLALLGDCGSATLAFCVLLRGMNAALLDLIDRPELVHAMMEKGAAIAIERGKFNVDLGIRLLRLNDSVANMSVISPRAWREFVLPHMKTVCDELHAYDPGVRIYCHICGNSLPILEGCVEAGLDCIGPLDPLGGFTCADARAVVGDRAALMGGVNTLSFVHRTPAELIDEARACIEAAGHDGGYVLGSGCALPRASRRENLLALHEAAVRFGEYR